ncbi:VLRF1 family aeRF1-type release factor [Geomicrobium sp. JCM 19039]|uniref:VLRF1 family aeRF1-type release factor n=1 Tax=Geomicrobium sp. JCM 19039 TaxID=1460636 RepID=UPI0005A99189|nr:VLRF1 family aeRF1-type release factor [Geomicrobium sp. JCM 19039]
MGTYARANPTARTLQRVSETGVIVTQKRDVLLIDTALGEVRDELKFHWNFETDDWVQRDAGHTSAPGGADTAADEFDRRFEENMQRWYKKLAPILTKELKSRDLDDAYFVGSKEMTDELTQHIDDSKIRGKVQKNLGSKPTHEILNTVYGESLR